MAQPKPNLRMTSTRANALWGRGGRRAGYAVVLGLLLLSGALVSATIDVPAASSRATDCLPVVTTVCPTVPTVTVPSVPNSVPQSTATSPPETATSTASAPATTADSADSANPQSSGSAFAYSVRSSVRKSGNRRWIDVRISLSRSAAIAASVGRRHATTASLRFAGVEGSNAFRLMVPRRAVAGRYTLTVTLATAEIRRTVKRLLQLPKIGR